MRSIRPFHVFFFAAGLAVWQGHNAQAVTRFVNASSASPASPYTNWSIAATNIQDAIAPSGPGDEILVAPGLYLQGTNGLNINASVVLRSTVPRAAILDGQNLGPLPVVNLGATNILIEGFTIKNGYGAGYGGGVAAYNYVTPFFIRDCLIVSNHAYGGGGVYTHCSGVVERCTIEYNTAQGLGGGVEVYANSNATIRNCIIRMNTATNEDDAIGGGVHLYGTGVVENCLIEGNVAQYGGGAALAGGSMVNCIVYSNVAANEGGGVDMYGGAQLVHCTVVGNLAATNGGGVRHLTSATHVRNSIVYFNSAPEYNDMMVGYAVTVSNTCTSTNFGDTNFTNAPAFAGAAPNFALAAGSSCIDRGSPNNAPANDYLGHPRPADGDLDGTNAWDVGAYEYGVAISRIAPAASTNVLLTWDVLPGKRYALDVSGPPLTGNWFNVFGTNTYGGPSPAVFTQSFPSALATNLVFRLRAFTGP
jgi:parallel beta-helix repeat protein